MKSTTFPEPNSLAERADEAIEMNHNSEVVPGLRRGGGAGISAWPRPFPRQKRPVHAGAVPRMLACLAEPSARAVRDASALHSGL